MDVIIVGGGAIGLAVGWRCAQADLTTTVFDPDPGGGASWAAAGMLAPVTEVHYGEEPLLALNLAAARAWPAFADELIAATGLDAGYRTCGTLTVARDLDDKAALAELLGFQQRLGLRVEKLSGSQARALQPSLSPRVRGGLHAPDDHQVDNRALVRALRVAAERSGVVVDARGVRAVRSGDDRVTGVVLDDGTHCDAGAVVVAAGVGTAQLEGLPPGVLPPIRPVKGQLVHLRGPAELVPRAGVVRGLDVYVVSRGDGRVVVGATTEERGHDTTVTAGAVLELLRAAWELLPGIAELELVETTAGLRPATPDNAPAIGATALAGLHVATGHYRNGILLAPVTADTVVEVLRGEFPELIAVFSPRRFEPVEAKP